MNRYMIRVLAIVLAFAHVSYAQNNEDIFKRLRAISDDKGVFYNIDGIQITHHSFPAQFSEEAAQKQARKYGIARKTELENISQLPFNCYYAGKSAEVVPGVTQYASNYFFANKDNTLSAVSFNFTNERDLSFELSFLQMLYDAVIPKSIFTPRKIDSIEFAGRYIVLGNACHWMNINNVQCPSLGQLDWSLHKDMQGAKDYVATQMMINRGTKGLKVVTDTEEDVVFEGVEVKARKLVFDITGATSLLVGMSGGKTLTVYYVAAGVRGYHVSCAMSTWNNDRHDPSGLPPLIGEVMKLKN